MNSNRNYFDISLFQDSIIYSVTLKTILKNVFQTEMKTEPM